MELLVSITSGVKYLIGLLLGIALIIFAIGALIVEVQDVTFAGRLIVAVPSALLGVGLLFWAKRNKREGTNQIRGAI